MLVVLNGQGAPAPGSPKVFEAALAHPLAEVLFGFIVTDSPTNQSFGGDSNN